MSFHAHTLRSFIQTTNSDSTLCVHTHAGDECARRWPRTGRILAAQFSVACGLPLSALLLKGLPTRHPDGMAALVPLYALVMAVFGLLITWCAPACAAPRSLDSSEVHLEM